MENGKKVYICDLLEHEEEEIGTNADEVVLDFAPFEIKTLRVRNEETLKEDRT